MRKQEFLTELGQGLKNLPQEDVNKSIDYYGEMIDDRVEDGLTEEDAVAAIGNVNDIISQCKAQIIADTPLPKLIKEKFNLNRSLKAWEIILLILGSPIWISLLLAAVILVFVVYALLWAAIAVLYEINLVLVAVALSGIVVLFLIPVQGVAPATMYFGLGIISAGAAILLFFGATYLAKKAVLLSKKIFLFIKSWFIKKEKTK